VVAQHPNDSVPSALSAGDVGGPDNPAARDVGELLDQVCGNALRFLVDTPRQPQNLRVRAGDVSVDIEWPEEHPEKAATGAAETVLAPTEPVAATVANPRSSCGYLTAPTVGVFYRSPESGATPFVSEGDIVVEGQQVGIIEAMKLMIPVEAERPGRITAVLKNNAEPVEYGDHLFAVTVSPRPEEAPCSARY
jgi:acetyl-CoA carboxylase biotin carboxyl carrier protein